MKKRHLQLDKKLFLKKELVNELNAVSGGGLTDTCPATGPCCQNTFQLSCVNSCFCPTQDACPVLTREHSCWQDGQTNCI